MFGIVRLLLLFLLFYAGNADILCWNCSLILSAIVYVLARAGGTAANCSEVVLSTSSNPAPGTLSTLPGISTAPAAAPPATADFSGFDIGAYRAKILSQTTPHIIECIEAGEGNCTSVSILRCC